MPFAIGNIVRRSHTGAVMSGPDVLTLVPLLVSRRWNAMPLPGVTKIDACGEPGVLPARYIRPAFVHGATFCTVSTCASRIVRPPPVGSARYAYCSSSAVPQMSAPLPRTLKTPLLNVVVPAFATAPMSWCCHGYGTPPGCGAMVTCAADPVPMPASASSCANTSMIACVDGGPGFIHVHESSREVGTPGPEDWPASWHSQMGFHVDPLSSE